MRESKFIWRKTINCSIQSAPLFFHFVLICLFNFCKTILYLINFPPPCARAPRQPASAKGSNSGGAKWRETTLAIRGEGEAAAYVDVIFYFMGKWHRSSVCVQCICCLQEHQMNPTSLFPLLPALSFPKSFVTFSRNSRPARRKSVPEPISPSSPVLPLSPIQLEGKINYDLPGDQLDSGWHVPSPLFGGDPLGRRA